MANATSRDDGMRPNWWRIAMWSAVGAIAVLPVIAAQVADDMDWTLFDFVFFGALAAAAGVAIEAASRVMRNLAYLAGTGVAAVTAALLIIVTGAVGIIGSEDHDGNLMYGAVLAAAGVGAAVARFRPQGMARAMVAAASVQALIAVIAIIGGMGDAEDGAWPLDILGVTAIFVALWLASAWLFEAAYRQQTETPAAAAH